MTFTAVPIVANAIAAVPVGYVQSLAFMGDQTQASALPAHRRPKLIEPSGIYTVRVHHRDPQVNSVTEKESRYGSDSSRHFQKPEWHTTGKNDPVSYTRNATISVHLEVFFLFLLTPYASAVINRIEGTCARSAMAFRHVWLMSNPVAVNGQVTEIEVNSPTALPDQVDLFSETITWRCELETPAGLLWINLGDTGPHSVYVTYATPTGHIRRLAAPTGDDLHYSFDNLGTPQVITERRLKFVCEKLKGRRFANERALVDALYGKITATYALGWRYPDAGGPNSTGVEVNVGGAWQQPDLPHYHWLAISEEAYAECHDLAAAFVLICRMAGVHGTMHQGVMYPWPSKVEATNYPKRADTLGLPVIKGRYNKRFNRTTASGSARIVFIDGNGFSNNFEGVARYGDALYPIGEGTVLGHYTTRVAADPGSAAAENVGGSWWLLAVDQNSSTFYQEGGNGGDIMRGAFELYFTDNGGNGREKFQYTGVADYGTWYWHT